MSAALTVFVALSLSAQVADPSDPEPPPAAVVETETAPPPPVVEVVPPRDPSEPEPPRRAPEPTASQPPAHARPKSPPPPEPSHVAQNPMGLGAGAGLGGCAGALVPGACGLVFPPAYFALPCTVPAGVIAGTAIAANFDDSEPETTSLFVGGAVAVVAAGVLGAAVGAGIGASNCQSGGNNFGSCEYAVPIFAAVGGTFGFVVGGPIVAGVTVGLMASLTAHPLTPPG